MKLLQIITKYMKISLILAVLSLFSFSAFAEVFSNGQVKIIKDNNAKIIFDDFANAGFQFNNHSVFEDNNFFKPVELRHRNKIKQADEIETDKQKDELVKRFEKHRNHKIRKEQKDEFIEFKEAEANEQNKESDNKFVKLAEYKEAEAVEQYEEDNKNIEPAEYKEAKAVEQNKEVEINKPKTEKIKFKQQREQISAEIAENGYSDIIVSLDDIEKFDFKKFKVLKKYDRYNVALIRAKRKDIDLLELNKDVNEIMPNTAHASMNLIVPMTNTNDVHSIILPNGLNVKGKGYSVVVADTGIDYNHWDLAGKIAYGYDFYNDISDFIDTDGHGTKVSGIIAGPTGMKGPWGNWTNVTGIAPESKIISLKVCNDSLHCSLSDFMFEAIPWAINNKDTYNISVISASFGIGPYDYGACPINQTPLSQTYTEIFQNATNAGIAITAASGNSGNSNAINYPACHPLVVSVGTSSRDDNFLPSNRDPDLDFVAPVSVDTTDLSTKSTWGELGYGNIGASSAATPQIAGAMVLVKQYAFEEYGADLNWTEIRDILKSTGIPIYDSVTGLYFPRYDLLNAVQEIDSLYAEPDLIIEDIEFYKDDNGKSVYVSGNLSSGDWIFARPVFKNIGGKQASGFYYTTYVDNEMIGKWYAIKGTDLINLSNGETGISGTGGFKVNQGEHNITIVVNGDDGFIVNKIIESNYTNNIYSKMVYAN